jgi:coenzyme F420-0:L-glutamate ligase/coenzyme F420-1:gamma-L-glutamate ligase
MSNSRDGEEIVLKSYTVFALEDFPLIKPGDDLAAIIVETAVKNGLSFENGDLIAVAQKIFSKAEGRLVRLKDVVASKKAERLSKLVNKDPRFVELVLRETRKVMKATNEILLVEDKRGIVCINAGIDKSNVEGKDEYALLPENPDLSAERCSQEIRKLTKKNVSMVICDTYSRPLRRGQVNFAIGIANINLFRDYRGKKDLFGQVLRVKNAAVADEIAGAAELLMGQGEEARPVIVFRGLSTLTSREEKRNIEELFISRKEDLFRKAL